MFSDALFQKRTGILSKQKTSGKCSSFCLLFKSSQWQENEKPREESCQRLCLGLVVLNLGTNLGTAFSTEDAPSCAWSTQQ